MSTHEDRIKAERAMPGERVVPVTTVEKPADSALSPPPEEKARSSHVLRRVALGGVALIALVGIGYWGHGYWNVGRFQISTDDAYVKADSTTIAPKVSGYIGQVLVRDNEPVRAGQVLARIDDRDFRVALDQAKADVEAARAAVASKLAQLEAQQSAIDTAKATVEVDKATANFAEQDNERYANLARTGYGSVQNAQAAVAKISAARAAIDRDVASLAQAQKQVDLIKADLAQARATVSHDEAVQRQAELNLSYTAVLAPVDGIVGNRTLRVGQYVQAGTQLMAVVPVANAYVVANFKETQLTNVKPGQKVEIEVDMFPGVAVEGHVDSIAPASGQEFALLPPDNATGNFTKVVQRVPVKIVLDSGHSLAGSLRPGMSVVPTIDTKISKNNSVADAR
ncbi:HlyD family secretion protein [Bosea psychrotolerans]|uniref:Membrane fusion protein (Multidrug efflux system) n=1 Tax=Bosea psychrotolerans TaxID=1871628 RepID=A0A2S4M0W0_9HYPH|nr:HlyD family secretion protein [Bosea psychrotolerans]POR48353.1 membrane fusion protein (multidrug efflux system) [Bosea psychrotolerans]